ncbi:hypothetical protein CGLAR1_13500 [Corynebacterium glutamicum]|uniref:hypothetical protein n=1 Tax=Corynebacterium glutamicum TaxID=1718 RepID=UPI0004F6D236|nr:hypothetical protein [Corynebacterium glutamicum]AIK86212.1 hypothetical protein CGLAR1_13500 [Corynebacterium glutamicum]AIK88995.1 hypothetical protein AR0_13635 [Corynebacterium glutamicum]
MKEDLQRRAVVKAFIIFLLGVLTGMYIGIMYANALVAFGFMIAGLAVAVLVYRVNRPRKVESESPRLE